MPIRRSPRRLGDCCRMLFFPIFPKIVAIEATLLARLFASALFATHSRTRPDLRRFLARFADERQDCRLCHAAAIFPARLSRCRASRFERDDVFLQSSLFIKR